MDIRENGCDDVDRIHMAQDTNSGGHALVKNGMNLWFYKSCNIFWLVRRLLTSEEGPCSKELVIFSLMLYFL